MASNRFHLFRLSAHLTGLVSSGDNDKRKRMEGPSRGGNNELSQQSMACMENRAYAVFQPRQCLKFQWHPQEGRRPTMPGSKMVFSAPSVPN